MSRSDRWDNRESKWDKTSSGVGGDLAPSDSIVYWQVNVTLNKDNENSPEPIDFLGGMKELANLQPFLPNDDVNMIHFERTDTNDDIHILNIRRCWYVASGFTSENVYETASTYVGKLTDEETSTIVRLWFEEQPWEDFVNTWIVWRTDVDGKLHTSDLIGGNTQ